MKRTKLTFWLLLPLLLPFLNANAQCIRDIYNLIESPAPCFFVGTVDVESIECYDPFSPMPWKYTWKIRGADDGKLIATYHGMAFQHTFKKFGGYEFCLEIEKDGNQLNGPEIQECATYTTCQFCGTTDIGVEYIACPAGDGCDIELKASFDAENTVGLKPSATFIVSYSPTYYESNGGLWEQDVVLLKATPTFFPEKGKIVVSEKMKIPYQRGCYKTRLVLDLEFDAGAHSHWGGPACQQLELWDNEIFRCIACVNENEDCQASILASQVSNESGTCEIFSCVGLRENPDETFTAETGNFRLSPNPAKDVLHLDFPENEGGFNIYLFNMMGQTVQTSATAINSSHLDLDTSDLPNGMFFLMLEKDGKNVFSQKIMIAK